MSHAPSRPDAAPPDPPAEAENAPAPAPAPAARRVRARALLLALALVVAALPGLLFVGDPFGRDQGVYAYIGWRWISGDVPYLGGGIEHKAPLPFAAYGLALLVFGHSTAAVRLLAWLATLAAAFGVAGIGARLMGRPVWGTAAGAVYLLFIAVSGLSAYWFGAQTEAFTEPLVVGAVLLALAAGRRDARDPGGGTGLARWAAAGAVLGIATLGKPIPILVAPALLLAAPRWWRPRRALGLAAGFIVPWALTAAYMASRGAAGAFFDSVFVMNLAYGGEGVAQAPRVLGLLAGAQDRVLSLRLLLLAAAGLWACRRRLGEPPVRLLVAWTMAAYAGLVLQGRLWPYHFWPTMAPVALLWALGLRDLARVATAARSRAGARVLAAATILAGLSGWLDLPWRELDLRCRHALGGMSEARFLAHFRPRGNQDVDPAETLAAAAFAERSLAPDQTLLVWGFEPAVNFLARRRSPTRFIYDYFLDAPAVPEPVRRAYWGEFWQDIERTPPDMIAVVHNDANPIEQLDSAAQLEQEPLLRDYVRAHYRPEARIGDFEFLRRVD